MSSAGGESRCNVGIVPRGEVEERGGTSGEGGGTWARSTDSVLSWSDGWSWG